MSVQDAYFGGDDTGSKKDVVLPSLSLFLFMCQKLLGWLHISQSQTRFAAGAFPRNKWLAGDQGEAT